MTTSRQYADSEGDFQKWTPTSTECPKALRDGKVNVASLAEEWDGHTHLPTAPERCPICGGKLLIDIEPFEGTVYYCRKCEKNVKLLPIQPPKSDD